MLIRAASLLFSVALAACAAPSITLEASPSGPQLKRLAGWPTNASERLIDHIWIGDASAPLQWKLVPAASTKTAFVYESTSPHLRLIWQWQARAAQGPLEHSIRIQNLTGKRIWLPLQTSLALDFAIEPNVRLTHFYVEKGASSPSDEGTHSVEIPDGYRWNGTSSTYAHPPKGAPREIIPYVLVRRDFPKSEGWYAGIEFSGRTRLSLERRKGSLGFSAGLNPDPGPFKTRLDPDEWFETPTVFLGTFQGNEDDAGNILRRWIRTVLNNPNTLKNPAYPTLVSNSWGSGMKINEEQAHSMIDTAASLGLELFHVDAGWFPQIGDWTASPGKFPHGIAAIADYAHGRGLKFGLWTDWTQAGAHNIRSPHIRDWLTVTPPADWKPAEFKGVTIDIGVPAAQQWAADTVREIVSRFHLDMLEHDGYLVAQGCERSGHPHAPPDPAAARVFKDEDFLWVESANDTDVSYHATRAYYDIQSGLRRRFPSLLLEICNDGGRMVDFGSAAHGDYFSTSDGYDPVSNRRAFFDASYVMPPAMLESYVEDWHPKTLDNLRYMLRSGMMGWFSLMLDANVWTAEQRAAARAEFDLYKKELRPLIRNADLYHVSARPNGIDWDGIEYFDPQAKRGVLYAFRGTTAVPAHAFKLQGLDSKRRYRISLHNRAYTATGNELQQTGVKVETSGPNTSELVFIAVQNAPHV